jgi:hypothetical protein
MQRYGLPKHGLEIIHRHAAKLARQPGREQLGGRSRDCLTARGASVCEYGAIYSLWPNE